MASEKALKRDERIFALEERDYSPEEEKMLKKMSDEFYNKYLKPEIEKAKKDAKKGN